MYLGAAPGVGKTYRMLDEGWRRRERGTDVVIGYVETHGRALTQAQVRDLEVVPRCTVDYRGARLEEMDLEAVLARRPAVALVDELAHTNAPGSVHDKRWLDVVALLEAGVDVITTVNIQHLKSVNDVVVKITGVAQNETVPDAVVRGAQQIELVDVTPEALRRRMAHGNIYSADQIDASLSNFFRVGNLSALRELALLWLADRVEDALQRYLDVHEIGGAWETRERLVVGVSGSRHDETLLRRAARMATRSGAQIIAVHVERSDEGAARDSDTIRTRQLCEEVAGRFVDVVADDVAETLIEVARRERGTQLVVGSGGPRSSWRPRGAVVARLLAYGGDFDVHVIATRDTTFHRREVSRPGRGPKIQWAVGAGLGAAIAGVIWLAVARLGGGAAALTWALAAALAAATTWELRRRRDYEKRARSLRYLLSAVLVAPGVDGDAEAVVLDAARTYFRASAVTLTELSVVRSDVADHGTNAETFALDEREAMSIRGVKVSRVDRPLAVDLARWLRERRLRAGDPNSEGSEPRRVQARVAPTLRAVAKDLDGPTSRMARTVGALVDGVSSAPAVTQRQRMRALAAEVDQLGKWRDDLERLARLEAGEISPHFETVSVGAIVERVLRDLGEGTRPMRVDVPEDLPEIISDAELLSSALLVAVRNAKRFTARARPVRVTVGTTATSVEILVIDSGPGISAERRAALLEGPGTFGESDGVCVGLRLATGLTRLLGGQWLFEDTPAGGLTVVLALPLTR